MRYEDPMHTPGRRMAGGMTRRKTFGAAWVAAFLAVFLVIALVFWVLLAA